MVCVYMHMHSIKVLSLSIHEYIHLCIRSIFKSPKRIPVHTPSICIKIYATKLELFITLICAQLIGAFGVFQGLMLLCGMPQPPRKGASETDLHITYRSLTKRKLFFLLLIHLNYKLAYQLNKILCFALSFCTYYGIKECCNVFKNAD